MASSTPASPPSLPQSLAPYPAAPEPSTKELNTLCFCISTENGTMVLCEDCFEWYHFKCLRDLNPRFTIPNGSYTCTICEFQSSLKEHARDFRPEHYDVDSILFVVESLARGARSQTGEEIGRRKKYTRLADAAGAVGRELARWREIGKAGGKERSHREREREKERGRGFSAEKDREEGAREMRRRVEKLGLEMRETHRKQ